MLLFKQVWWMIWNNEDVFIVIWTAFNEPRGWITPVRCGVIRGTSLLNLLKVQLIISGPEQRCYPILIKTMFIEASLRIYIIWIIPFINSPTSPFGDLEIRVINLWVSQEFPKGPPVDCSAGLYLLVVPMSLQLKTAWPFVKKAALFYIILHLSVCFPEQLQTVIYLYLNLTKRSFFFFKFFFYYYLSL